MTGTIFVVNFVVKVNVLYSESITNKISYAIKNELYIYVYLFLHSNSSSYIKFIQFIFHKKKS